MERRVDFASGFIALSFSILYVLLLSGTYRASYFNAVPPPLFPYLIIGVGVGIVSGTVTTMSQLRSLEKKREYKTTFKTWICLIAIVAMAVSIFWYLSSLSFSYAYVMINFLWISLISFEASRTILYVRWERKYERFIMTSGFATRIYAVPETEKRGAARETSPNEKKNLCVQAFPL